MVGEIRDTETAQIAIQSALTGHLVFTTVHANNVVDVLGRFLNMGSRRITSSRHSTASWLKGWSELFVNTVRSTSSIRTPFSKSRDWLPPSGETLNSPKVKDVSSVPEPAIGVEPRSTNCST